MFQYLIHVSYIYSVFRLNYGEISSWTTQEDLCVLSLHYRDSDNKEAQTISLQCRDVTRMRTLEECFRLQIAKLLILMDSAKDLPSALSRFE